MREAEARVARERMVAEQLEPRGIRDPRVLDALRTVPRHRFTGDAGLPASYGDHPLPIGDGQTISQPYMVALMTELLEPRVSDRVLEVGTGSGYGAAILSRLVSEVCTVERIAALSKKAEAVIRGLGYTNVLFFQRDGTLGLPEEAPFNGIVVTAGAPAVPEPLLAQLAEGGRLVVPVGGAWSQDLVVCRKREGRLERREVCGCVFVPLLGEYGWKER